MMLARMPLSAVCGGIAGSNRACVRRAGRRAGRMAGRGEVEIPALSGLSAPDLECAPAERTAQGRLSLGLVVEQRGALDRAGGASDGHLAGLGAAVLDRGVVEQHAAGGEDVHVLTRPDAGPAQVDVALGRMDADVALD